MTQRRSKNHHFVPRLYLRRFAVEERIVAIQIKTGQIFENQNIREVASEKHLNRPDGALLAPRVDVEREIADRIEDRSAPALRDFPNQFPPTEDMRNAISDFILLQMTRHPKKRQQYEDLDMDAGELKDLHLASMLELTTDTKHPLSLEAPERQEAREAISARSWLLCEAPEVGSAEFITSDSPVHLAGGTPNHRGLIRHADVYQVFLALDRRRMLIMEQGARDDDRRVGARPLQILDLNRKTVQSARRFAYAHPDINRDWLRASVRCHLQ